MATKKKRKSESVGPVVDKNEAKGPNSKKMKIEGLYKPPTHDELQSLKETESLYRTNLIKLQITELLSEIKPLKQSSEVENLLYKLKEHLMTGIPSTERVKLSDSLCLLPDGICYPLTFPPSSELKGHFQFSPPTKVKVIGSYLLETGLNDSLNINISLQIPEVCLQEKDYLNYRYFHKRALYLSIIGGNLIKNMKKKIFKNLLKSVKFGYEQNNHLLPVLILEPKGINNCTVILHTSIPSHFFPLHKLLPTKNSVRWLAMPHPPTETELEIDTSSFPPPTPRYNSAILIEMESRERHLEELYSGALECSGITEATLLCKTWLRQRELDKGYGSFSGFHSAMILFYLLRKRKLNQFMSSYQIFRIFLQFIATSAWDQNGISLADRDMYPSLPPIEEFHSIFPVVFIDSSGYLNLFSHTSLEQYRALRYEAQLSHTHLDTGDTCFSSVFLKHVTPFVKYDSLCQIRLSPLDEIKTSSVFKDQSLGGALLDSGGWVWPHVVQKVVGVVSKGLEGRVQLIGRLPLQHSQWDVTQASPPFDDNHVTLGLIFNTDTVYTPLIMGPPADSSEATSFRSFWGEKSDLRRFPDSGINEAVLWEGQNEAEKRTIPHQILQHVLKRHAHLTDITVTHTLLDAMLTNGKRTIDTSDELSVGVVNIYTELSRQLRQLKGLPLDIATVKGASPILCHTEVCPSYPWNGKLSSKLQSVPLEDSQSHCLYPSCDVTTPPLVPCCHVVIQMEASGKWPDDEGAINDIKTAFYVAISKQLHTQYNLVTGATKNYLDVLKSGYVFRLHIHYPRELSLLNDDTSTLHSLAKAEEIERRFVSRPLLISTLLGLHNQFPLFSVGVRLCKKWVCSHLLTNQIPDELVELLVSHLFIHPEPFTPPGSSLCVFVRFLKLLVSHDWSHDPLLINLNNQFTDEVISDITSSFNINRDRHPLMYVATPLDHTSKLTKSQPNTPVLIRLLSLAKTSLDLLTNQIASLPNTLEKLPDFKQIFRTPLSDYNLLIHLDIDKVSHLQKDPPTSRGVAYNHLPVVQFDTVELYIQTLEAAYSNLALFFYNKYGGHVIGVVWRPNVFKPHPYKVTDVQCYTTINRKNSKINVSVDREAIINDMTILGEGLVTRIEVLNY